MDYLGNVQLSDGVIKLKLLSDQWVMVNTYGSVSIFSEANF